MPKKRPIFEFTGLSGIVSTSIFTSSSSSSSYRPSHHHHHSHTRRPSSSHHRRRRRHHHRPPPSDKFVYKGPHYAAADRKYRPRNLERAPGSISARPIFINPALLPPDQAQLEMDRLRLTQSYLEQLRKDPTAVDPELERILGVSAEQLLAFPPGAVPNWVPVAAGAAGAAGVAGAAGAAGAAAGVAAAGAATLGGPPLPANYQPNPINYPQPGGSRTRTRAKTNPTSERPQTSPPTEASEDTRDTSRKDSEKDEDKENDKKDDEQKGKKLGLVKGAALTMGALALGYMVKRFLSRRKESKNEEEAEQAAIMDEIKGPFGGVGGNLLSGPNPLTLPLPPGTRLTVRVPENEAFLVEKGGQYDRKLKTGSNLVIPCVERVAHRFTLREVGMGIPLQQCFTRDNVSIKASAVLFGRIEDPVAAAYEVDDIYRSLMLLAQTCLRNDFARLDIEQAYDDRDGINFRCLTLMNEAARPWGMRCTRFEIRDLEIPDGLRNILDQHAHMERQAKAELFASEAQRDAMINRAEGEMQAQMRMSQARQIDVVNQAIGEAHAITEKGEAIAGAMRDVADVVNAPGGEMALQMRLAEQYLNAYGQAAASNGTAPDPEQTAFAMNNAMELLNNLGEPGAAMQNPYAMNNNEDNFQSPQPNPMNTLQPVGSRSSNHTPQTLSPGQSDGHPSGPGGHQGATYQSSMSPSPARHSSNVGTGNGGSSQGSANYRRRVSQQHTPRRRHAQPAASIHIADYPQPHHTP